MAVQVLQASFLLPPPMDQAMFKKLLARCREAARSLQTAVAQQPAAQERHAKLRAALAPFEGMAPEELTIEVRSE